MLMWLVRSRMVRLAISIPLSVTIIACLPRRRIRASCSRRTPIISASLNLHVWASLAFGSCLSPRAFPGSDESKVIEMRLQPR
jgi:hypothetical protein